MIFGVVSESYVCPVAWDVLEIDRHAFEDFRFGWFVIEMGIFHAELEMLPEF